jgi:hypothetical protein
MKSRKETFKEEIEYNKALVSVCVVAYVKCAWAHVNMKFD